MLGRIKKHVMFFRCPLEICVQAHGQNRIGGGAEPQKSGPFGPKMWTFWTSTPLLQKPHFWPTLWLKVDVLADLDWCGCTPCTPLATGFVCVRVEKQCDWKGGMHAKAWYDVTSNLEVGSSLTSSLFTVSSNLKRVVQFFLSETYCLLLCKICTSHICSNLNISLVHYYKMNLREISCRKDVNIPIVTEAEF